MLSMLDSELKRFHDRVISPYDYSIYFRVIDLVLATIVAMLPLIVRDLTTTVVYSNGIIAVVNFMIVFAVIGHFQKLYSPDQIFETSVTIRRFILTAIIAFFILLLISFGLKSTQAYSRIWFFSWMGGFVISGIAVRLLLISYVENQILKGNAFRRALIVTIGQGGNLSELSRQSGKKFVLLAISRLIQSRTPLFLNPWRVAFPPT